MAILSVGASNFKLQGLSSDVKPMDAQDGATFHVIDTGEQYIMHDGMWEPDLRLTRALEGVL